LLKAVTHDPVTNSAAAGDDGQVLPGKERIDRLFVGKLCETPKAVSQYRVVIKVARSGFSWQKTTERFVASIYGDCETPKR
jgi:hypothetical protein